MKINGTFTLRDVAGEILAIPVGESALKLNGMIVLNPVSKVIWERLEKGATEDELITAVTELFDVDPSVAKEDVTEFIADLTENDMIYEE